MLIVQPSCKGRVRTGIEDRASLLSGSFIVAFLRGGDGEDYSDLLNASSELSSKLLERIYSETLWNTDLISGA